MAQQSWGPYEATVLRIHDGDTLQVQIDLGFGITISAAARLFGINAPELSTQEGKDALAFLLTQVAVGDRVIVMSYGWDKYGGRFDATVKTLQGADLGTVMVASGHAAKRTY